MNIKSIIFFVIVLFSGNFYSQSDTTSINPNKLVKNPVFFGVQVEAVSAIAINELGISGDYDLYSSINKKYNDVWFKLKDNSWQEKSLMDYTFFID